MNETLNPEQKEITNFDASQTEKLEVVPDTPIPPNSGKLPSRPRITAGMRMPGVSAYRINNWLAALKEVAALEERTRQLSLEEIRKESLSLRFRAKRP